MRIEVADLPIDLEERNVAEMRRRDLDNIGAIFSQSPAYRWPCDYSAHLNHPHASQWTKLVTCFTHRGEWHRRSCRLKRLNKPWALLKLAFSL